MRYRAECYFAAVCPMFAIKKCFLPLQLLSQKFTGVAFLAFCHFFGSAGGDHIATLVAAFRTEVDDIVGALYYVHIVLYDYYAMAVFYELVERLHECFDVVKVESGGGFVEDKQCGILFLIAEVVGEFHALVLTTRKCRRRLSQFYISKANILKWL